MPDATGRLTPFEAEEASLAFYHGFNCSKATSDHGKILDGLTHAFYMKDRQADLQQYLEDKKAATASSAEISARRGRRPRSVIVPPDRVKTLTLEDLFK